MWDDYDDGYDAMLYHEWEEREAEKRESESEETYDVDEVLKSNDDGLVIPF